MNNANRHFVLVLLLVLLAVLCVVGNLVGCGPLLAPSGNEKQFFVLNDISSGQTSSVACQSDARILIREAKSNPFINSHKIVFSESPTTRGYYQLAQWIEPPTKRFTLLLVEHLQKDSSFKAVSRMASSSLGDLQLNTEITDFHHDISSRPGSVKIRLIAEVIDLSDRDVVGVREFERTVPSSAYDAEGAVEAMTSGISEVLEELALWICQLPTK